MVWNPNADHSSPESQKCKWDLVKYTRGRGLDLGSGPVKPFPHFIGVDVKEFHAGGIQLKPDLMMDASDLSIFASQSLDFVFTSHLLQEVEDYKKVLREAWRVLKPWGHLIVYLPSKKLKPVKKKEGVLLPHEFDQDSFIEVMREFKGWNLLVNEERNEGEEYSFFQVYFKLKSEKQGTLKEVKPEKTACVVRYGAFGDMLQTSPILAGLKAEGFHVTLLSQPPGSDVILDDPNVDSLQLQDRDQVPNSELGEYWGWLSKRFDRFVNLSETVEGALLTEPGKSKTLWNTKARHRLLNHNYMDVAHDVAGLTKRYPIKFYPAEKEKEWARKQRKELPDYLIMWSLAGSAVHKTWPYLDQIIARVLTTFNDVGFVLVGGPECEMLEAGWEKEKRVLRTSGKWVIRQTLAFLDQVDMVIGPETGVLNAASNMEIPKIIFLSHSSVENLTRDWKNTVSLTPKNTPCYPCHILHQGWQFCFKDEEKGVAKCQSDISPDDCWEHVERLVRDGLYRKRAAA